MKKIFLLAILIFGFSCSSPKFLNDYSSLKSMMIILKFLQKIDLNNWHNLDPEIDSIPGTSVERAYDELLNGHERQRKVIVAVIDTGLDIDHESLSNNIMD